MIRTILGFIAIAILLIVIIIKTNRLNKNIQEVKEQQRENVLFIAERFDKIRFEKIKNK